MKSSVPARATQSDPVSKEQNLQEVPETSSSNAYHFLGFGPDLAAHRSTCVPKLKSTGLRETEMAARGCTLQFSMNDHQGF